MDERYICYCGLYCENCAVLAKLGPAAKVLYNEMKAAGLEEHIHHIPGGDGFWPFLKHMAEVGMCVSCREGSGDPGCAVRICAKSKNIELCALCESYPCEILGELLKKLPFIERDNALIREKGLEAWAKLQDERRARGFVYQDEMK